MRLGYFTLTDNPPAYGIDRKDPNRLLQEVMAQCLHAEEIGLNSVWVPEEHLAVWDPAVDTGIPCQSGTAN